MQITRDEHVLRAQTPEKINQKCAKLTQIDANKKMRTNAYPKTLRLDPKDFPVPGKSLQSREKSAIIPLIQYHSCLKHLTRTFLTNDS